MGHDEEHDEEQDEEDGFPMRFGSIDDLSTLEECTECGVEEGDLHLPDCDMEVCPVCAGQRLYCGCTEAQVGGVRVPYINWPQVCARCGALWPGHFMVPKDEWERYVERSRRDEILCLACLKEIKRLIDTAAHRRGER